MLNHQYLSTVLKFDTRIIGPQRLKNCWICRLVHYRPRHYSRTTGATSDGLKLQCIANATFLPRCMECTRGITMRKLSVRSSVCQTHALWQNVRKIYLDFYTIRERSFSLVFWDEGWLVGRNPFYLKFWVNRPPLERNRRFSTDIRS